MTGSGGEQYGVTGRKFEVQSTSAAKMHNRLSLRYPQTFMCVGVIVNEAENAISPAITPSVRGKECFKPNCGITDARIDHLGVENCWPFRMVWHVTIVGEAKVFCVHEPLVRNPPFKNFFDLTIQR